MPRTYPPALIAAFLFLTAGGCSSARVRTDDHTIVRTPTSGVLEGRPTLGMPIAIAGHTTCLLPFSVEDRKGLFADPDPYTKGGVAAASAQPLYSGRAYAWRQPVRWHNAIVRDNATGEEWTILDRRGVIATWYPLGPAVKPDQQFRTEVNIFLATLDDTNKDGVLNDVDASVAIAAAGDCRNPRIVTPPDCQVWDVQFDESSGRVHLYVVADTDHDGKFTFADVGEPWALDPRTPTPARTLVSRTALDRVQSLLK